MNEKASLLPRIRNPQDIKDLSFGELELLAEEIRAEIVSTVSKTGGHLASNLGVVELSIALHRVFASPEDKIVWDVGRQCYAHKLLTGRYGAFSGLRKRGGISGFPKRAESVHDVFDTGHASTSISAALGLLAAERLRGGRGNAVAVIGDGALTGGLAYEALSHAGQLGLPLVVVLNDNKMSISPNVGGLSKYLSRLSMKAKYQLFRRTFDSAVKKIPYIGGTLFDWVVRLKRAVKAVFYTDNFFVDLGFEYAGPIDGHNIQYLTDVFEDVRKLGRPVVIHVITRKGKGYHRAEQDPGLWHGVGAFSLSEGLPDVPSPRGEAKNGGNRPSFTEAFSRALLDLGKNDERLVAVTAAMEKGTGLSLFREAFPGRFFDVGIAEAHGVCFAAGLAVRGMRPVTAFYSSFIQRAIDQVIHDVCLQNLPVIFALDHSGFVPEDGETHQGLYDIALFRAAPGMSILAPAGERELASMLAWALRQEGPVMIRYPKCCCPPEIPAFSEELKPGRGVFVRRAQGARVLLAFTGGLYREVIDAAERLEREGIETDLYNLRFIKPLDEDYLVFLFDSHELTLIAEEGIREGGFGEYAAALARNRNCRGKLKFLAVEAVLDTLGTRQELLEANGLDGTSLAKTVSAAL
ncbi:MAG: 1-deoxy-D-xylulose-5-phosphate synthase [Treponema sp.]|jgi:1-deoxy-D-xylulose-5-phosphate synthase|nr:1-deoxy-D-xylulose-5-phosphate synthase [Treponema sp.]